MESYIQYATGYQKDNININDIKKAILDIQEMDEEHGAFWVSVITEEENVIETDKDLQLAFVFGENVTSYKASNWNEVLDFYELLVNHKFDKIKTKINDSNNNLYQKQ